MLLDFDVQRVSRRCAATDTPLEPGDECVSVLEVAGAEVIRKDYRAAAWKQPPDGAFAWWRTRIPEPVAKKIKLAPNDVLLELFDQLAEQPAQQDMRYVLTLLLIRRRVFRLEEVSEFGRRPANESHSAAANGAADAGQPSAAEMMCVYCAKREATYDVAVCRPGDARVDEIQQHLSDLLIAGAE